MLEECLRVLLADLADRLTERRDESSCTRVPALQTRFLIFENASSIGLYSGE
jgi:hypothetical protein